MVIALQHLEIYAERVKAVVEMLKTPVQCASYNMAVTFTDDELLLGSKPHNRPLFVAGYIKEQKVETILVDGGPAVHIMLKSVMHDLGITIEELSKCQTMIQMFKLEGQHAFGMIRVKLVMGNLSTSSIFHVIDAKTSYKLLLGLSWLHGHGIVASTLNQCLKYYRGRERMINGSVKPFTRAESHFTDARFFEEDDTPKETMPTAITSTWKGTMKNVIQVPKEDMLAHQLQREENQLGGTSVYAKQTNVKVSITSGMFLSLDERKNSRHSQNV